MPQQQFNVGDAVAFSRDFLRNTGQFTGRAPFIRGTVASVDKLPGLTLALVNWNDGCRSRVNVHNLVLVGRLHLELA
jgi:hypothetical protein